MEFSSFEGLFTYQNFTGYESKIYEISRIFHPRETFKLLFLSSFTNSNTYKKISRF